MLNNRQRTSAISSITVSGFKSLVDPTYVQIRPLTILAGANSSGKSSVMQPILLMKQTLEASFDPGPLLLLGQNARFTAAEQFLVKREGKRNNDDLKIHISLESPKETYCEFTFSKKKRNSQLEIAQISSHISGDKMTLKPNMKSDDIIKQFPEQQSKSFQKYFERQERANRELIARVDRSRCFLVVKGNLPIFFTQADDVFAPPILQVIHVPGLRVSPERAYNLTPVLGPMFQGRFDEYMASVVNDWKEKKDPRLNSLEKNLTSLGLTSKLATNRINDVQLEIRIGRTLGSEDDDTVSILDVGFGVSQVLPVLVALLVARPGQLVYIEQPELHLHPRAQVALAEVLAIAANRGVRVVIETHSDLLLLGIQTLVAEGKLGTDKVKLHWFERNENGVTQITSSDIDSNGSYEGWPEDFADVQFSAGNAYLDAVEKRRAENVNGN